MGRCVVVIEDEAEILQILRDVLELEEYKVIGVARPELAQTAASAVRPDLFLVDIMLPGMSGIELAEQLRATGFQHTPMIGMSASKLMSSVASGSGLFQDVLDKPFDLPSLLDTVERYTSRSGCVT
ncbi:MAG: response regulator transcription factor [Chloroflexi bacterium]|nr:response regulator transcription factor [Chloroflexota bacterium]